MSDEFEAVRHPAQRWMWWHRLISLGRRRRFIEADIAVVAYRTRNKLVVLDSEPATKEARRLWDR